MDNNKFNIKDQKVFFKGTPGASTATIDNNIDNSFSVKNLPAYDTYSKAAQDEYESHISTIFSDLMEQNYKASGMGSFDYLFPKMLTRFDKFNKRFYTPNQVFSGYTFITRPRLCLTAPNLQANRFMQLFNTTKADSIQFAIRCLLDTKFSSPFRSDGITTSSINQSPYFDPYNPFIPILSNTLQDMSGSPSQHIEPISTEGGYFSEDMRIAIGSDRYNKSFDVSMTFTDIEGGLVDTLFKLWMTYIDLVTVGECMAYPEDIVHQRLNYTVSIYRFLTDPTNRFIEGCAKYTGCFPIDRPAGARYDISRSERYVEAAKNFTIQFVCNKFEENDPIILLEFNTLMQRYCPWIAYKYNKMDSAPYGLDYNYVGLPYIKISDKHRPILDFRYVPYQGTRMTTSEYTNDVDTKLEKAKSILKTPSWII